MAAWSAFVNAEPEMAVLAGELLEPGSIAYLATVRRDGSPRVHPVCPIIAAGRMYIAVVGPDGDAPSPKRFDLLHDGRFALHALPGKRDDEFYATGRAARIEDSAIRAAIAEAAGHTVHATEWIFELDLEYVMTAYWEHVGQPNTYAVRRVWRAGAG